METITKTGWKKELNNLKYEYLKKTAPGFFKMSGAYTMKLMPYKDTTTNGLTKCIQDYLNFKGHLANRINTQGQARKERVMLAFGNYREIYTSHHPQQIKELQTCIVSSTAGM